MAARTFVASRAAHPADSLLTEGYRLMRERLPVYLALAAVSAVAGWFAFPSVDIYAALTAAGNGHPLALFTQPPVSVVFVLSIGAIVFVLPSALRSIQPGFRMTILRLSLALGTLLLVGVVVDAGYAFAVFPGIAAAVLLSQVLVGALLRAPENAPLGSVGRVFGAAFRGSIAMTRGHFATTFGVVAASLALFVVPATFALLGFWILGVRAPLSLVITSPALFLLFVYCECVRYALIVRWYRRLAEDHPVPAP